MIFPDRELFHIKHSEIFPDDVFIKFRLCINLCEIISLFFQYFKLNVLKVFQDISRVVISFSCISLKEFSVYLQA
jgi:hypothetical protein